MPVHSIVLNSGVQIGLIGISRHLHLHLAAISTKVKRASGRAGERERSMLRGKIYSARQKRRDNDYDDSTLALMTSIPKLLSLSLPLSWSVLLDVYVASTNAPKSRQARNALCGKQDTHTGEEANEDGKQREREREREGTF